MELNIYPINIKLGYDYGQRKIDDQAIILDKSKTGLIGAVESLD